MNTTLKEIANLAGVSESTVSRALNNSPLISERTRLTVFAAAQKLNYQVTRTNLIGVLLPKINNPLYGEIVSTVEARAYEFGYSMVLCVSAFDLEREEAQIAFLLRQGVMGMIVVPIDAEAAHIRALVKQNMPCVILGTVPILGTDQVNVDASMGAYLATSHLLELGHRCIGMLSGPSRISACKDRVRGYCQALEEYGIQFDPSLVVESEIDEQGGLKAVNQLLPKIGQPITALFAISDVMALGVLRRLHEAGFSVPDHVSLVSCDDIPVAEQLTPGLTSIWQPKAELGEQASTFLFKQIEAKKARGENWKERYLFQSTVYHPHLVLRNSTKGRL